MRTTVEINDEQHHALDVLARRRGLRGFSPLVQEAIDQYLQSQSGEDLQAVLSLRGSLPDDRAESWRRRIEEAWSSWTTDRSSSTPTS
jgi:hypothetical protein